jgi:CheY-like chemotaxis protein
MTANAMNGDDNACFDAGMDDYMAKPIDADILFEKLSKWVASNNPPSVTGDV